jgi:hypothetical protein
VKRKPPPKRRLEPWAQELPPEMSAEELEKKREKTRALFDEFRKSQAPGWGNTLVNELIVEV